jgi:hypothetical protein
MSTLKCYSLPSEDKIYIYDLSDNQAIVDLAMQGAEEIKASHPETVISNVKSKYMSPWNSHVINNKFIPLCQFVEQLTMQMSLLAYGADIKGLNVEFRVTDCWYARYEPNDFTVKHKHYPADWSAVVYCNVDETSAGIIFDDKYKIQPTKNMLLLFPGYLNHEVPPTEGVRDVIAFNIFKKATFIK